MSKLSQLQDIQKLNLPTAPFAEITWNDFKQGSDAIKNKIRKLQFPVAVRSTYSAEDGENKSYAGAFHTALNVTNDRLESSIEAVFRSYPHITDADLSDQSVIVQQMIPSDFSGVLFAFRDGVWKCEFAAGLGENIVSAVVNPEKFILPTFYPSDNFFAKLYSFWKPFHQKEYQPLVPAFIALSVAARKISAFYQEAEAGIDIEFSIYQNRLYILQARPITTPYECEDVLTSANHKEILPPIPSHAMISLIDYCSDSLSQYYTELDPTLPSHYFIRTASGMPWINLSALLEVMLHWGLPTSMVCKAVGAADFYKVSFRPHRALQKLPVFLRVLWQQITIPRKILRWTTKTQIEISDGIKNRKELWSSNPAAAVRQHFENFSNLYTGLVGNMQALTGSMAGPLKLADKLGILPALASEANQKSSSNDYLQQFHLLKSGKISREEFIKDFGHRGFYESDIGQERFAEYSNEQWEALLNLPGTFSEKKSVRKFSLYSLLFKPLIMLIARREWIRNECMKLFWQLRKEISEESRKKFGAEFNFAHYRYSDLELLFAGKTSLDRFLHMPYPTPVGWDMDTFLINGLDKRTPISHYLIADKNQAQCGIGIYPGIVTGHVWRIKSADFASLVKPDYPVIILIADTLDPGWVPYFTSVQGVGSYVGGLLSHASIILRESAIPSVTAIPAYLEFNTGDLVTLNGATGEIEHDFKGI